MFGKKHSRKAEIMEALKSKSKKKGKKKVKGKRKPPKKAKKKALSDEDYFEV